MIRGVWLLAALGACGGEAFTSDPAAPAAAGDDAATFAPPGDGRAPVAAEQRLPEASPDAGDAEAGRRELEAAAPSADARACLPGFSCLSGSGPVSCPPGALPCARPGDSCAPGEVCCETCP